MHYGLTIEYFAAILLCVQPLLEENTIAWTWPFKFSANGHDQISENDILFNILKYLIVSSCNIIHCRPNEDTSFKVQ